MGRERTVGFGEKRTFVSHEKACQGELGNSPLPEVPEMMALSAFLLISSWLPQDVRTAEGDQIQIANVCVVVERPYQYAVSAVMDYTRVDISLGDQTTHVYVGYNPDLAGDNRATASRRDRAKYDQDRIVILGGSQSGEVLGVPARLEDMYFHIWRDGDAGPVSGEVADFVAFC